MNQRERKILTEVYRGLNEMTGLNPLNPMDISAIAGNLKTSTRAARDLMFTIYHLGTGEYAKAEACAAEARKTLEEGRSD